MLKKSSKKSSKKYVCKKCDYHTNRKSQYDRHLQTKKHNAKNAISDAKKKVPFVCECGKSYKQQPSLSRHKKTCTYIHNNICDSEESDNDVVQDEESITSLLIKLIDTNEDLKEQIIDLASKPRNVTNTNTFNLNNYLNVQCKDAMNLSDFLETINYTFNDLLHLGRHGFVKSIQNTFVKQLEDMEQTKRPIHCTDKKRKTMYVKDDNKWGKDQNNGKIASAIKIMNKKQLTAFTEHSKGRPEDYLDSDSNLQTQNNIIQQMCGYTQDTCDDVNEKIIRNISTKLQIDR